MLGRLDSLRVHADSNENRKNKNYYCFENISEFEKNILKVEITLTSLVLDKHISKLLFDTLVPLLKNFLPDSRIMQSVFPK